MERLLDFLTVLYNTHKTTTILLLSLAVALRYNVIQYTYAIVILLLLTSHVGSAEKHPLGLE